MCSEIIGLLVQIAIPSAFSVTKMVRVIVKVVLRHVQLGKKCGKYVVRRREFLYIYERKVHLGASLAATTSTTRVAAHVVQRIGGCV